MPRHKQHAEYELVLQKLQVTEGLVPKSLCAGERPFRQDMQLVFWETWP